MSGTELVGAWLGGIIGGVGMTLGTIERLTGRIVINSRRLNWSGGEVRVHGAAIAAAGLILAAYTLAGAFVLSTGPSPHWLAPTWWDDVQWLIIPVLLTMPLTTLLLQQHHHARWPFDRPRKPGRV